MVITAVLVASAMTVGVYADMMPISPSNVVSYPSAHSCNQANSEPTSPTQPSVQVLTTDRSSRDLCLYTLLGLGLCQPVPSVKKLHLGVILDWYHHGGPSQIGHSHAIEANCLCSTTACLVQPDNKADDFIPQHHLGTIAALWLKSQFTPFVLAPRAPPAVS